MLINNKKILAAASHGKRSLCKYRCAIVLSISMLSHVLTRKPLA